MLRARMLLMCPLLIGALLIPAGSATAGPPARAVMIAGINDFRASLGLPRLRASRSLNRSAVAFARLQMRTGRFGHSSRGIQASRRFAVRGEVLEIHRGRPARYRSALRSWKHSGSHRSVLLSRRIRYIGAGYVRGRYHGRNAGIWVVHVGRL